MIYTTVKAMEYCRGVDDRTMLEIPAGTTLQGLPLGAMSGTDAKACKGMAARHRRDNHNTRMVFFKWEGVVRGAVIGPDLKIARRRP